MFGFDSIWPILGIVLGFGVLIFVHELGHFLAAKAVGIRATQFAIGFGQALVSYRKGIGFRRGSTEREYLRAAREHFFRKQAGGDDKRELTDREIDEAAEAAGLGETEYRLNWMPLGGYVKMRGQEDLDPTAASDDPRSFNRKAPWARAIVISAGVVMNLIFAVVFFVIAFMIGVDFPGPVIGGVAPDSPASKAQFVGDNDAPADMTGLQAGDVVLSVNGEPVKDFLDLRMHVALARTDSTLDVLVNREGYDEPLTYRVAPEVGPQEDLLWLGVGQAATLEIAKLVEGEQLAPAFVAAGVKPGMVVTAVNGKPVTAFHHLENIVEAARGSAVTIRFTDPETGATADMSTQAIPVLIGGNGNKEFDLVGLTLATEAVAVIPNTPADKGGVQAGDVLRRVGSVTWPTVMQAMEVIQQRGRDGRAVEVEVWRDNKVVKLGEIRPDRENRIGIQLSAAWRIAGVAPDSPFASLALPHGTTITAVNGTPINDVTDAVRTLQQVAADATDKPLDVSVSYVVLADDMPTASGTITLSAKEAAALRNIRWAVEPSFAGAFASMMVKVQTDSPLAATALGIDKTHQFVVQTYQTLAALLRGSVPVKSMRGPLGIVHVGTKVSERGFSYLLFFLGMISVNLVVINFLPIPILDGGLMVFLIIEKLKGSPVSVKVQTIATVAGLALIASIFLIVTYYDIGRFGE